MERQGFLHQKPRVDEVLNILLNVLESILIGNNDNGLKLFNLRTQIQDLWANKDSALRQVMRSWSALIGRWKSRIVICEVGFQDLQLANMA